MIIDKIYTYKFSFTISVSADKKSIVLFIKECKIITFIKMWDSLDCNLSVNKTSSFCSEFEVVKGSHL